VEFKEVLEQRVKKVPVEILEYKGFQVEQVLPDP